MRSMHGIADGLHEGCIQAFFGDRVDVDAAAARTVTAALRDLAGDKVGVMFADVFTARISGQDDEPEAEDSTRGGANMSSRSARPRGG